MLLTIRHTTHYSYDAPIDYALQRLRLTPKHTSGQTVHDWTIDVTGGRREVTYDDAHRNCVTLVTGEPGTRELIIECHGSVETADNGGVLGPHEAPLPVWYFARETKLTKPGAAVHRLVREVGDGGDDRVALCHRLSAGVREAVAYRSGATDVETTAEEALEAGHGVCQDQAHVFVTCARLLKLPARYVGGYLKTVDPDQPDEGHGWAEVHIDGLGWVGFDVTNGISPDEKYVRVATGLDYAQAAPVTGVRSGNASEDLAVQLAVQQ